MIELECATLISKSTNEAGMITYKKGTAMPYKRPQGVCLALTVMWLRNLIEFKQVKFKEDLRKASVLHGAYEIKGKKQKTTMVDGKRTVELDEDYWAGRTKLFESQNMKVGEYFYGTCMDAFDWIAANPHTYCAIKVPGHALAAYYEKPNVYFYDPNCGVYKYGSVTMFATFASVYTAVNYCHWTRKPRKDVIISPVTGIT